MEMYTPRPNSPWVSLAILIGLAVVFAFGAQLVTIFAYLMISGDTQSFLGGGLMLDSANQSLGFKYVLLASGTLGAFLFPAIFLQRIESRFFHYFPAEKYNFSKLLVLSGLFLICFNPIMAIIGEWNMQMTLPDSMTSLENWMRQQENEMADLTKGLVMTDSIPILLMNILVVAVLPAIGEEFFFRGALQGIVKRWLTNPHVAVWLTAVIFSAIHIQFFGFFPRLLLGAFFGYMLLWTQNIWIPVFAHFVNNAMVAIIAFVYTRQGKTYEQLMADSDYHLGLYFVGLVASVIVGWYFYSLSLQNKRKTDGARLG